LKQEFLIFEHTIDGLLRAIGSRMTPRLELRLKDAGLDLHKKRPPAYPFETWKTFLRICREELYGRLPEAEGYRRFGEDVTGGYFQTLMGSALAGMVRLLGPVRTLKRATQSFRSANNFTETQVKELGPNHWELWMNHVDHNDFNVGIVKKALETAGAKSVEMEIIPGAGDAATFKIRWK
jgi:uncharacterized protein (TIGR02265 family)